MVEQVAGGEGRDWARIGLWLVGATMAYNVIEAGIALWSGAEAESIALVGFPQALDDKEHTQCYFDFS